MILVTGSSGQLGQELRLLLNDNEALFCDKFNCDVTNIKQLEKLIVSNHITSVVNCAAYTAVDLAESDESLAFAINTLAPEQMAKISLMHNLNFVHISTDYVFDGKDNLPFNETSKTNPLSVYGKSKLEGEKRIMEINPRGVILRTSWLYSRFGKNFLKTIINHGKEKDVLKVVFDQVGTPTYAKDLAEAIVTILPQLKKQNGCNIFHYSNEGVASWYDFAQSIKEFMKLPCDIVPVLSGQYPTIAIRPTFSVLSKEKIKNHFNLQIPYWRDSLKECIKTI